MNTLKSILLSSALISTAVGADLVHKLPLRVPPMLAQGIINQMPTSTYPTLKKISGEISYAANLTEEVVNHLTKNFNAITSELLFTGKIQTLLDPTEGRPSSTWVLIDYLRQNPPLDFVKKLGTLTGKIAPTANIITIDNIDRAQDGDHVFLSYDNMVANKSALDNKDVHLHVDVYADANGQLFFNKDNLPEGLKKLYFQNTKRDVTRIGDRFLLGLKGFTPQKCKDLTHVGFSGFTNVTRIGANFLQSSISLTSVDLSGFKNVTMIEDGFLSGCFRLTHVDLSGFKNLRTIEHYFLSGCKALTKVDLSGFTNVTIIRSSFLSGCKSVRRIVILKSMGNIKSKILPEHREKIIEVVE